MRPNQTFGIEYTCMGNNGRSPLAEVIAGDYIRQLGLEDKIKVYSSGIIGDKVKTFDFNYEELLSFIPLIERGQKNKVFCGAMEQIAGEVIKGNPGEEKIKNCIKYLAKYEATLRNLTLLEIGLLPGGPYNQQTIYREDVRLILPFDKQNIEKIKKMPGNKEKIVIFLNEYAKDFEEIYTCGVSLETFRKSRDVLAKKVRKSIDKAIGEFGLAK